MKIGESVSVPNLVGEINHQKQPEVSSSTIINLEKAGGSELLEKSLEAMAQGWGDLRKLENVSTPVLTEKQMEEKTKLEEKGLSVTVRPDGKFIVEAEKDKSVFLSSSNIENVAVLKGNFEIYNGHPQSDVEYKNLESVVGNLTISGFDDECRTSGPNWGYACDVEFSNLKEVTGDFNIQNSACQLYLDSLEKVGGSFNVGESCQSDNQVFLNNIETIKGDFSIQVGCVHSTPQIFAAVEGTMNAIPPKSHSLGGFGSSLIIGQHPNEKYYEFTTQEGVIKKYTI